MPNINGRTLALAIQAVDFKMSDLERIINSKPPDQGAELESLFLSYSNAAEALKLAYKEALLEVDNLPPYEDLVHDENKPS